MTSGTLTGEIIPPADPTRDLPDGMLEYQLRTAIRDYRRRYGFDDTREVVAGMLNDEAGGWRRL